MSRIIRMPGDRSDRTTTLINFIQDRSGSMAGSGWLETLNGFKVFIDELKRSGERDSIDYLFSLTTFDTIVERPVVSVPIANVDPNELTKHEPRGGTALYDAVGKTLADISSEATRGQKVIVIVVTDGQENCSREWTKDKLNREIEARLTRGNWTFQYLGTQPETWADAQTLGVGVGSIAGYTVSSASIVSHTMAAAVHSLSVDQTRMGTRSMMTDYVPVAESISAGMLRHDAPSTLTADNVTSGNGGIPTANQTPWRKNNGGKNKVDKP